MLSCDSQQGTLYIKVESKDNIISFTMFMAILLLLPTIAIVGISSIGDLSCKRRNDIFEGFKGNKVSRQCN